MASAQALVQDASDLAAGISALRLGALGAAQCRELDAFFGQALPGLFETFPNGTLWHVSVDPVLSARMALGRIELVRQTAPDVELGGSTAADGLSGLSLTSGIDFSPYAHLGLLTLSPAVFGFCIPAFPHYFVFLFGFGYDLRLPWPSSLASIYRPGVLHDPEPAQRSAFLGEEQAGDGEALLAWWVERLNVIYSHATDVTRFTDENGYFDASAQTAWLTTVERLLGDMLSLLAEPQATDLDRVQIAFDLLDKTETLLGYGKGKSGKGFSMVLRRTKIAPRLRAALRAMPNEIGARVCDEFERQMDDAYAAIRNNTYTQRLTTNGVQVAKRSPMALREVDNDTFVSTLLRVVRNSSHGLLDILRDGDDRFFLSINTGDVPAAIPALVPYIALGLVADIEGVIDGSWRQKLQG